MSEKTVVELKDGEVECKDCHRLFVPSFVYDYYDSTNSRDGQCESCMMRKHFKKSDSQEIPSDEHLREVCKWACEEETCRYLYISPGIPGRMECCAKGSDLQYAIDVRGDSMEAKGDNCSGIPEFKITLGDVTA